ncbi:hemolysin III family protein [Histomonas meleagridis]|uniref:hemolysin III family protein n=1 Tax=Histomonas meleagridis TaxID=135588 RepID=UPI003559B589|nr:hemolysin III family protein [Histomonas meleagridis]KAH0796760.1 hemolysin III family protein [Histomonas meleagridis]
MSMKEMPVWAEGEEFVNSLTHGIAAALSVVGTYFLFKSEKNSHCKRNLISKLIFGLSMIILYTASCVYHGVTDIRIKKPMRYIDHCSVFLLIAGSYTPVTVNVLWGKTGKTMLISVWTIALIGIFAKIFFFDLIYDYTVYFYIALGWVVAFNIKTVYKALARRGMFWLALGGVTYTLGTYFYAKDYNKYYHAIFHIFILFGTVFQYIAILKYT